MLPLSENLRYQQLTIALIIPLLAVGKRWQHESQLLFAQDVDFYLVHMEDFLIGICYCPLGYASPVLKFRLLLNISFETNMLSNNRCPDYNNNRSGKLHFCM